MSNPITICNHNTTVTVSPEGGTVILFQIEGKDIFFPQRLFSTPSGKKYRGGMPLLFPNAGPVGEGSLLPQNGFARDLPWRVTERTVTCVVLELASTPQTLKDYPHEFKLQAIIEVQDKALLYSLRITNRSDSPLVCAPGLHPYFYLPQGQSAGLTTSLAHFDSTHYDWSSLQQFTASPVILTIPGTGDIKMNFSPVFRTISIWTMPNQPFICIEPWIGTVGAIDDPKQQLAIPPYSDESLTCCISITG